MPKQRRVYLARPGGTPTWESDWTNQNGHYRSEIPDEAQLVGFANYDLNDHGLPKLTRSAHGEIWVEVEPHNAPDVLDVIRRHGFEYKT